MSEKKQDDKKNSKKDPATSQSVMEQVNTEGQNTGDIKVLEEKVTSLEKALAEQQEITKKAQHEYINLKMDFDRYQRQQEEAAKTGKESTLIDVTKKFLPFVEDLRKSIDNIPEEKKDEPLAKGVTLVYNKFITMLGNMGIKPIDSIGLEPDSYLHEPVSTLPTDDKKMKGKIVQEFERGFYMEVGGEKKVISTSKVVVGQ